MTKKGLGKGLGALLPSVEVHDAEHTIADLPLNQIFANKNQPRTVFNEEKLQELASSIKEHGVVQPIIVRKLGQNKYELVAGERRWRASKLADLKRIPAVIKDFSPKEISEIALIENIQREDLNPLEEAAAFDALIKEHGLTQEQLSERVGKSRPFIANSMRLLGLPLLIKEMVARGDLSSGHARALMSLSKEEDRIALAKQVVAKGMSVRQVEEYTKGGKQKQTDGNREKSKLPEILELEEQLRRKFSTRVSIQHKRNSGKIEIEYFSEEELQRLLEELLDKIDL